MTPLATVHTPDGPQRIASTADDITAQGVGLAMRLVCPACDRDSGLVFCAPEQAGKVSHRLHDACVPAYRARLTGKESVSADDPKAEVRQDQVASLPPVAREGLPASVSDDRDGTANADALSLPVSK